MTPEEYDAFRFNNYAKANLWMKKYSYCNTHEKIKYFQINTVLYLEYELGEAAIFHL